MAEPTPGENIGQYNVDIPDEVIASVIAKLNEVDQLMKPYWQVLSEDEKDHLPSICR